MDTVRLAEVYAFRDMNDQAFEVLLGRRKAFERAHGPDSGHVWYLQHESRLSPFLKTLHSDPRWSTFLATSWLTRRRNQSRDRRPPRRAARVAIAFRLALVGHRLGPGQSSGCGSNARRLTPSASGRPPPSPRRGSRRSGRRTRSPRFSARSGNARRRTGPRARSARCPPDRTYRPRRASGRSCTGRRARATRRTGFAVLYSNPIAPQWQRPRQMLTCACSRAASRIPGLRHGSAALPAHPPGVRSACVPPGPSSRPRCGSGPRAGRRPSGSR